MGQTATAVYVDGVLGNVSNFNDFLSGGIRVDPLQKLHVVIYTDDIASAGTENIAIGADTFGAVGTRHLDGDIAEIIIYDRALSVSEITRLNDYLERKWGI
jgi:hypothetical protein